MTRTFTTTLCWTVFGTDSDADQEADVRVTYEAHKGYPATLVDPSEPDSVEITDIARTDGGPEIDFGHWCDDEALLAECMQDWAEDCIAAAEYRAECRAEDRIMEGR